MSNESKESAAKTLSRNKIKKVSDRKVQVKNRSIDYSLLEGFELNDSNLQRGWYDLASISLRYIDSGKFNNYNPENREKSELFKVFATTRCICIGCRDFIGCEINIKKIIQEFKKQFFADKSDLSLKIFEICMKSFQQVSSCKTENSKLFNKYKFKKISESIYNEEEFYKNVNDFLDSMKFKSKSESLDQENQSIRDNKKSKTTQKTQKLKKFKVSKKTISQDKEKRNEDNLSSKNKDYEIEKNEEYKVYTKQFDVFLKAEKLLKYHELKALRQKFDEECKDNTKLINHLAKKLEKLLFSLDFNTWKFDEEEGFFDSSRFSQFIANPNNSNIFKLENENIDKNTIVSLLLDNSGSMRGKPIVTSAMTAEIITKTLEKCRVNVEILGFTTKEWKGGNSKKLWEKNKSILNPGRLNDLFHIVYKDADTPWNNAKLNLGLVLKDGILKENIDGEALIWASDRLRKRTEKKKILIVISDGAPVDDATLSTNNSNILDNHLREVVNKIEKQKEINLIAIGIGHDVSKYYSRAFTIDDVDKLGEIIIDNLTSILKERK